MLANPKAKTRKRVDIQEVLMKILTGGAGFSESYKAG